MRVVVASTDAEAVGWLRAVLGSAGMSVATVEEADPAAPELTGADLLIADGPAATAIGSAGPKRRLLLIPRGHAVDLSAAMAGGFIDLIVVPSPEEDLLAKVGRALDRFQRPQKVSEGQSAQAEELKQIVGRVGETLRRSKADRTGTAYELAEGMLAVFLLMIDAHETAERGVAGHSKRTGTIVRKLAEHLGSAPQETAWLELAGRLHDLGMVPMRFSMRSSAPLTPENRRQLNEHPKLSAEILAPLASWGLPVAAIAAHHERLDGSGYPRGLEGEELTLGAQILGIADAYEALTSARPWRPAETSADALAALRASGGFSDAVVDALEATT